MARTWILAAIGGLMLLLAARTASAADACLDACAKAPAAGSASCAARCSPAGDLAKPRSRPRRVYGAIAYGAQSTASGYSYAKRSARAADRTALAFCRKNGADCKIVATIVNQCAAVAALEETRAFTLGYGGDRAAAESAATGACAREHGAGCVLEVSTCTQP